MRETRSPPDGALLLEWVFGYNGHTARNNVKINAEGNLVYYVAGVGVVHDHVKQKQNFFTGHNDDITSLAISSDGKLAATGQLGRNACIAIWNAVTCVPISIINDAYDTVVSALAFSSDSELLASVGRLRSCFYLRVWDWRKGRKIAQNVAHSGKVEEVEFHPTNSSQLATCGDCHTKFWTLRGNVLQSHMGLFINSPKEDQRSITFLSRDRLVSGSSGGHLLVWINGKVANVLKNVHPGGVSAIETFRGGIITGGIDGTIKIFDENLNLTAKIPKAPSLVYETAGPVQSLSSNEDSIVVGTRQNEIWLMQWTDTQPLPADCIVQGHGQGEIWGLATHPSRLVAITGSDDKTLRLWSLEDFGPMATRLLDQGIRSVGFNPSGSHVAVGLLHGSFIICDSVNLEEEKRISDRKEARHDLRFSPDGKLLAVASNDNFVDVYSVEKNYDIVRTLSGASSFITHVDWATDSKFLQTNSGAGERILFQINGKGNGIVDNLPKGVEWASWTCVLGKEVDGLWAKYTDITDINAVDANFYYNLIVSGDDFGRVKLFRFPCTKRGSKPRCSIGHSEHVTNVRWTFDSGCVVSVGGSDHAVVIWKFRPSRAMTSLTDSVTHGQVEEDSDEEVADTEDELEAIPEITEEVDKEISTSAKMRRRGRHRTLSNSRLHSTVELCDDSVFAKRRKAKDEENVQNEPPSYSLAIEHVFG